MGGHRVHLRLAIAAGEAVHDRAARLILAIGVQGRRDLICPARNAWLLHKAWPEAILTISDDAGHAPFEDGNREALVAAMEALKDLKP